MKVIYLGREKRNGRLTILSRKYRKTSAASFDPLSHLVIGFDSGFKETANRFHEPSRSTNQLDHTTAQEFAKCLNSICHVQGQVEPSLAGRVAVHQPDPARLAERYPARFHPRPGNRFAGTLWGRLPIGVPANYLLGIDRQKYDFDEAGFWSYFRGQWRQGGWWYYYLYALAIKEPLGTWLLALLALAAPFAASGKTANWRDELLLWAPAAVVLLLVSSQTGFNHHMRYVLPMFPLAYIGISRAARDSQHTPALLRLLVLAALAWSVGSSLWHYPHSLAYFNEAVGGPRRGHEHLLDSNIDWGQDLLLLKRWLDRHPHVQPIAVAHQFPDWMLDAADIRIPPIPVPAGPPQDGSPPAPPEKTGPLPGWYAVFVHQLRARHGRYDYFLRFPPTATVGYTVTIYHISVEQANRVRRDLGLPDIGANQSPGGHAEQRCHAQGSSGRCTQFDRAVWENIRRCRRCISGWLPCLAAGPGDSKVYRCPPRRSIWLCGATTAGRSRDGWLFDCPIVSSISDCGR